jgi:hypothetical protein
LLVSPVTEFEYPVSVHNLYVASPWATKKDDVSCAAETPLLIDPSSVVSLAGDTVSSELPTPSAYAPHPPNSSLILSQPCTYAPPAQLMRPTVIQQAVTEFVDKPTVIVQPPAVTKVESNVVPEIPELNQDVEIIQSWNDSLAEFFPSEFGLQESNSNEALERKEGLTKVFSPEKDVRSEGVSRACEVRLGNVAHHPFWGHQVRRSWRHHILSGNGFLNLD